MLQDKKKPDIKEFTLTSDESSEYAFVVQNVVAKEEEYKYWQMRAQQVKNLVKKRIGCIDTDELTYGADFSKVFSTGKIFVTKIPKPKIVASPEEKKGVISAKPELQPQSE